MTWYLVMVATGLYIGPLEQERCGRAGFELNGAGVVCMHASVMTTCSVLGRPELVTSCPVFEFPRVTVKP